MWTGILATIADVAMGSPLSHSRDDTSTIALTVDLVTRALAPIGPGRYDVAATVLKHGRSLAITECTMRDDSSDGRIVAHSVATFMPIELEGSLVLPASSGSTVGAGTLAEPYADAVGIAVEWPGVATVERRPYTLQPAGTIQGGVVCSLVEVAAASLLGGAVTDLEVRFLGQVRTGPARATAERLDDTTARVVVTDDGRGDGRPTAFAVARLHPTP